MSKKPRPHPLHGKLDDLIEYARRRARKRGEPEEREDDFIRQRIRDVGEEDLLGRYRKAHIDLLRSGVPLSLATRDAVADALSNLWPGSKLIANRQVRHYKAGIVRMQRDALLGQMRGKPRAEVQEALRKLAKQWGHNSYQALCKALTPSRVNRRPR